LDDSRHFVCLHTLFCQVDMMSKEIPALKANISQLNKEIQNEKEHLEKV